MQRSDRWLYVAAVFIALTTLSSARTATAMIIANAANDFSVTNGNPNGDWTYGQSSSLGGTVNVIPNAFGLSEGLPRFLQNSILHAWSLNDSGTEPFIAFNPSGSPTTAKGLTLGSGELALHPGSNGFFAVLRWTVPSTQRYLIRAVFSNSDNTTGATTDVHILRNSGSLFDGVISGQGSVASHDVGIELVANDRLDFVVGVGTNGTFINDSTALALVISNQTPEPTTMVLLCLGLIGAGASAKKRAATRRAFAPG